MLTELCRNDFTMPLSHLSCIGKCDPETSRSNVGSEFEVDYFTNAFQFSMIYRCFKS